MDEFMLWFGGDTWTFIDALVTILTLLLVIYNWYQNYKQNQEIRIQIVLQHMNITKVLAIPLIRKNFTRSELFGILGAYDKDSKFCIEHTSSIKFFEDIRNIQEGKLDEISIIIKKEDKFDMVNL